MEKQLIAKTKYALIVDRWETKLIRDGLHSICRRNPNANLLMYELDSLTGGGSFKVEKRQLTLGQKLSMHRRSMRMSQAAVSKAIGMGGGQLSKIENDKTAPTRETLLKLAKCYKLSLLEKVDLFDL
jgi:DNA-binding XRE family transcriptional regulator